MDCVFVCCALVMRLWVIFLHVQYMVETLQLSLMQVDDDTIVYDDVKPVCYPVPQASTNPPTTLSTRKPTRPPTRKPAVLRPQTSTLTRPPQDQELVQLVPSRQSWGEPTLHDKNIGRVICRGMGYTHLDRMYKVKKEEGIKSSRLMVACRGYEALIAHCVPFESKNSKCEFLMGLMCDTCSRKLDLTEGVTAVITSPEYPRYSDDVLCVWRLQAPTLATITINFTNFKLPNLDSEGQCTRGMLEVAKVVVEEEDSPVTMSVVSMCGASLPPPLSLHAHAIILKYTSGVFYPRSIGRQLGFKVLITANAFDWSPSPLKTVEVVAVVLAVVLVLLAVFFLCYVCRRSRLGRQRSKQRKVMQERLAFQRPTGREVALTTMMNSIGTLQGAGSQFTQPVGVGRGVGMGTPWLRKDSVTHTTSVPMYPPQYPIPLPPPLPTYAPPSPTRHRDLPVVNHCHVQNSGEMYEQPIYMEVGQYCRSPMVSYIQLEDIKGKDAVEKSSPCDPLTTTVSHPPTPSSPYTNDLLFSQSPFVISKISSLSPSTRICPSNSNTTPTCNSNNTPTSRASTNFINLVNRRSISSRGSSVSSNTGSISPFPGHTPLIPCDRSCSDTRWHPCTLSPRRQNNHNQRELETLALLTTPTLERLARDSSVSSCESVFTQGETKSRKAIRCACGSLHSPHAHLGLSFTANPQGQLSKSCSDVSPTMTIPETAMLDELVRSEPSLPREQQPPGFMDPVLRRVSEMLLGSSPFLWPTQENKNPAFKKTECGKLCKRKEVGIGRSISKSLTDAGASEDKVAPSDRCLPHRAASTSSFHRYKYNRLENDSNTDCASPNGRPRFRETKEALHSLETN